MTKTRIDKLLVELGLVDSREKARALVMAGDVLVEDVPVRKAGAGVERSASVRLRRPPHPFVGRGGVKLRGALDSMGLDPSGWVCADVGASTGGFTHCLLRAGARTVYAIDVDTKQLDWRLRNDPRVHLVDVNARYLSVDRLPERVDLVTVDVSFISLQKVLPGVSTILGPRGRALLLVKPQFELERGQVAKGGIVTDPALQKKAVRSVLEAAELCRLSLLAECESPITGKEGNREFFVLLQQPVEGCVGS